MKAVNRFLRYFYALESNTLQIPPPIYQDICELANMKKTEIFHYLTIALATLIAFAVGIFYSADTPKVKTIKYEVTNLGTLGSVSAAYGLNDLGQVVGTFRTSNGKQHAFFWDETNGMQSLTPSGNVNSHAYGINNLGQVAGNVGYRWNKYPNEYRQGFLWDKTNCIPIPDARFALDINDIGQIVGQSPEGGVLWNSLKDNDLLDLRKTVGLYNASSINNVGQIIGPCRCRKKLCIAEYCFWDSKKGTPNKSDAIALGFLGGKYTWAFGMNDLGQVVGESSLKVDSQYPRRAFIWDRTQGMRRPGTLDSTSDGDESRANDINNAGQVVGYIDDLHSSNAFLWDEKNGMQNLNNLIDPNSGWHLQTANGINDKGWIVGQGKFNRKTRAFLLKPISR